MVVNDIGSHEDMLPTLLAAAGDPAVKEDLRKGRKVGNLNYKVHIDGYNLLPALQGKGEWPRKEFLYWTDDGSVAALRYNQWVAEHMFAIATAGAYVGQWLQSFREFPPRQKPGSFNLDRVMEAVTKPHGGSN